MTTPSLPCLLLACVPARLKCVVAVVKTDKSNRTMCHELGRVQYFMTIREDPMCYSVSSGPLYLLRKDMPSRSKGVLAFQSLPSAFLSALASFFSSLRSSFSCFFSDFPSFLASFLAIFSFFFSSATVSPSAPAPCHQQLPTAPLAFQAPRGQRCRRDDLDGDSNDD